MAENFAMEKDVYFFYIWIGNLCKTPYSFFNVHLNFHAQKQNFNQFFIIMDKDMLSAW